jgi:hypothetical protein
MANNRLEDVLANSRLRDFFAIAMAVPFVVLPFIDWYLSGRGPSWLQLASAGVLLIAVVLAGLKRLVPKVRKLCEFSVPRVVEFLAVAILAMIVLWSLVKGD